MTNKAFTLSGFVNADPGHAIEAQIGRLRAQPGLRLVGIVELERYRVIKDDDAEADPTIVLRISDLELAKGEQEALLRSSMTALHLHRTAGGTLTEDADIQLAQDTLDKLPDLVSTFESARLRAAFEALVARINGLAKNNRHNDGDLRRELKKIVDLGLRALAGEQLTIDGTGKMPAKSSVPAPPIDLEAAIAAIPDDAVGAPA